MKKQTDCHPPASYQEDQDSHPAVSGFDVSEVPVISSRFYSDSSHSSSIMGTA